MFSTLDRYILRSLLVNFAVSLCVMISLYVVLDMFVNMDEFTESGRSLPVVLANICDYYWPNVFLYYAQLSGVITLFSCVATVARMRRLNEMTAMLASGISLYRVARPVLVFGFAATGLLILDTEWIIPRIAHKLARDHDDVDGTRTYEVLFQRDRDGALLSARRFQPDTQEMRNLLVIHRDDRGRLTQTLEADRAVWEPPADVPSAGRWRLERGCLTTRVMRSASGLGPAEDRTVTHPAYFESDLSPQAVQIRQAEGWIQFLSLQELRKLLERRIGDVAAIIRTRHARVATPIVGVILLLLGLPFFLDRSPSNVLVDATKCVLVCGLCYVVAFVAQSVRAETDAAVFAWIPIFVFGTLAMVLLDRVRT